MKKVLFLSVMSFFVTNLWAQDEPAVATKRKVVNTSGVQFVMTNETEAHDASWLQWPHQNQYGAIYSKRLDQTWVEIVAALSTSEKVNIIAFDDVEKARIIGLLKAARVSLSSVDIKIMPTDDVWARDNGPIFARNKNGELVAEDYGFNGWGKKSKFTNCDLIPGKIAKDQNLMHVDLNGALTLESGSIQMDNSGTLFATKSSLLNNNRNMGKNQQAIETVFKKNLGATRFIWLKGSSTVDNTDFHIDNFMKIINDTTMVTMEDEDLLEWQVSQADITTLKEATNDIGTQYTHINLPLTKKSITTVYGKNLGYKASYVNFYIANTVVLVPNYNDENDTIANEIIQGIFPDKKVIGIDIRNLYASGASIKNVIRDQPKKMQ